ncbi:hypothetical protein NPJ88_006990 [Halomonas elongata]|uniref:hypothetical protein n=1 Tax=Halomonas elongata TaxID=2746 RepID=UPI00255B14A7|nr:hypothetical protein [Halomonas elongata]MDL4862072.1 hypothetical protein [Halomonas elongata]
MSDVVTMTIPRPMYNDDAELDLASCLLSVLDEFTETTTPRERERITRWLAERARDEGLAMDLRGEEE